MKIEFKQSFVEDGQEFRVKYKGKAGEAEVPAHFIFLATFFALLKAGLIKILAIKEDEFKDIPEDMAANISEEDQAFLQGVLEEAVVKEEEESEESDEDEGSEDDKKPSDSSDSVDSGSESSPEQSAPSDEVKKSQEEIEAEKLKAEYDSLHEKAKRLNKKEKERYEEIKSKLGIEG